MELSDDQIEKFCEIIANKVNSNNRKLWVDRQTHYNDHTWIADEKAKRDEERAFKRKVIQSVTIWAIFLVMGAVVAFLANAAWRSIVEKILDGG